MKIKYLLLIFVLVITYNCTNNEVIETEKKVTLIANNFKVPKKGVFNDFIIITGKDMELDSLNFSFDDKQVSEKYQPIKDSIYINIPRTLKTVKSNLKIYQKIKGKDSLLSSTPFNLKAPKIISVEKSFTTYGEAVVVYGENFDLINHTNLFVNDVKSKIVFSFKDSLKFIVPNELIKQTLTLKVQAQLQEGLIKNAIKLKAPELNFVKEKVHISEELIIKGKRFNPIKEYSKVILNNEIEASIVKVYNSDSIRVKLPLGPFKEFKINSFKYITAGMEAEFEKPLEIISNYILYNKNYPGTNEVFHFQNNMYTSIFDENSEAYYLWKFDIKTQNWSKHIDTPMPNSTYASINISENGNLFIYMPKKNDNFYKINILDKSIEKLKDFPGIIRRSIVLIAEGNKVYLGKGGSLDAFPHSETYKDLFSYNIGTKQWVEEVTDASTIIAINDVERINGRIYFQVSDFYFPNSSYSGVTEAVMEFNTSNLSFSRVYGKCSSCHTEELFVYKNQLFLGVSNTGFLQIYNYSNINENLSINGDLFYQSPSNFMAIDNEIYFRADVANYFGTNKGYYKINPKLIQLNFK